MWATLDVAAGVDVARPPLGLTDTRLLHVPVAGPFWRPAQPELEELRRL